MLGIIEVIEKKIFVKDVLNIFFEFVGASLNMLMLRHVTIFKYRTKTAPVIVIFYFYAGFFFCRFSHYLSDKNNHRFFLSLGLPLLFFFLFKKKKMHVLYTLYDIIIIGYPGK